MNYKISIFVEDENENIVCDLSTTAGMADFEENVIRKAESAIKDYESQQEAREQEEIERQEEDEAYFATDEEGTKEAIDKEENTTEPF